YRSCIESRVVRRSLRIQLENVSIDLCFIPTPIFLSCKVLVHLRFVPLEFGRWRLVLMNEAKCVSKLMEHNTSNLSIATVVREPAQVHRRGTWIEEEGQGVSAHKRPARVVLLERDPDRRDSVTCDPGEMHVRVLAPLICG